LVDDRAGLRAQDVLAHIVERLGKGRGGPQAVFLETTVHSGEEDCYMRFAEMKLLGMFAAYDQGRFTVRAKAIT
jgi:hypothetical protein